MKSRLTAVITGRAREVGPIEAHERTVLAAARKVEQLARRRRELTAELKRTATALRVAKREFRLLLQRHPDATLEQLEAAGRADAADRSIALSDRLQAQVREMAAKMPLPACCQEPIDDPLADVGVIEHNHQPGEPCNALSCPVARHTSQPHATAITERWPS
jgi:hypothetical protein